MTFLPLSCTAFTSMICLNTLAEYMSKCERDAVNEGWSKLSEGRQLCLKQWGPYNSKPLRFSSILLDNNSLLSKVCLHFTDPLKEIVHKTPSLPYRNKLKVFCSAWTWMESSGSLSKWNVTFHDFSMQLKLWAAFPESIGKGLNQSWHCIDTVTARVSFPGGTGFQTDIPAQPLGWADEQAKGKDAVTQYEQKDKLWGNSFFL